MTFFVQMKVGMMAWIARMMSQCYQRVGSNGAISLFES